MKPYTHFSSYEREKLQTELTKQKSMRQIAYEMNRSPSSITREIKRNSVKDGYGAIRAHIKAADRHKKSRRHYRLDGKNELSIYITECIKRKKWSVGISVMKYKATHPGEHLSASTVYRAIRDKRLGVVRKDLLLGKIRKNHQSPANPKGGKSIEERAEKINNRAEFGHWEIDTIVGKLNQSFLFTAIERQSRYTVCAYSRNKSPDKMNEAIFKALNEHKVKTLTADNGSEFSKYEGIETHFGADVYFCHTHAPWERGAVENINRYYRRFFPKGTDFSRVSAAELESVVALLNNTPKVCLGLDTPADVYCRKCCTCID